MAGALFAACLAQDPTFAERLREWYAEAGHYQAELGELLRKERERVGHPLSILETGVRSGLSTDRILTALDAIGDGTLVSVDPYAEPGLYKIKHPRWELVPQLSHCFFADLADGIGLAPVNLPIDVFLHDSDHEVWCQTLEYEIAWYLVRPGGVIATDDSRWGPHGAWLAFLARHSRQEFELGSLRYTTKPNDARVATAPSQISTVAVVAAQLADAALAAWKMHEGKAW